MAILYLLQGATLLMFSNFHSFGTILAGSIVITFSYGAMLAVYPSTIADFYGTRNMGFNYAILFTAWGVAGVCGPLAADYILDATGGYGTAHLISSVLCFFTAGLGLIVKPPPAPPSPPTRPPPSTAEERRKSGIDFVVRPSIIRVSMSWSRTRMGRPWGRSLFLYWNCS